MGWRLDILCVVKVGGWTKKKTVGFAVSGTKVTLVNLRKYIANNPGIDPIHETQKQNFPPRLGALNSFKMWNNVHMIDQISLEIDCFIIVQEHFKI